MATDSPLTLLHRAAQFADELFVRETTPIDITPRQYAVLVCVSVSPDNEDLSQSLVTARTGVDRSTTSAVVGLLVKRHLVARRRSKRDSRSYALKLTKEGADLLRKLEPRVKRVERVIQDLVPVGDCGAFLHALRRIAEEARRRRA